MVNTKLICSRLSEIGIPMDVIRSTKRDSNTFKIRAALAATLYFDWKLTQKDIAEIIGTAQGNITKVLKKHLDMFRFDYKYKTIYSEIKENINHNLSIS